jgi:glycosyltransferase involved in cell wall biosynthesis
MPKLVLIDQAIVGRGGHHFEYALHVLRAAKDRGFAPVLAVNRHFPAGTVASMDIRPIYTYGAWLYQTAPRVARQFRRMLKPTGSGPGTDWDGHSEGHSWVGHLLNTCYQHVRRRTFACDTHRLFRRLAIDAKDHVFLPTVSPMVLGGVWDYFRMCPDALKATWHFLFNHDPPTSPGISPDNRDSLRSCLIRFHRLDASRLLFYTDSEDLTIQYNRLDACRFKTLPIPHTRHGGASSQHPNKTLCVAYLGDARVEKGYQHLPYIVRSLRDDLVASQRVRFEFQSNFPSSDGEREVVTAWRELQHYPPDMVRLVTRTLSTEAYEHFLDRADIILMPYDPKRYASRNSGILAEALAAGKPVVVPAGTWMARQVGEAEATNARSMDSGPFPHAVGLVFHRVEEIPSLLRRIIDSYPEYSRNARQFARSWIERHNALRLLATLLENAHRDLDLTLSFDSQDGASS